MPKKHGNSQYKKTYAKALKEGMRRNGASVEECCQEWGIVRATYYNWIKKYPDFAEAHEVGQRDFAVYVHQLIRYNAEGKLRGNAGVLRMMAATYLGLSDSVKVETQSDNRVQTVNINVIPSPEERKSLGHKVIDSVTNALEYIDQEDKDE